MSLGGLGLSEYDKRRIRGDVDYLMTPGVFANAEPVLRRGELTGLYIESQNGVACMCPAHPRAGLMLWREYEETHLERAHPGVLRRPCPLCGCREGYWTRNQIMPFRDPPDGALTITVVDGVNTQTVLWYGRITEARAASVCVCCEVDILTWPR